MPAKQLQPAPGEDTLASFSPVDEVELERLDRSRAQNWGTCPRMAALIDSGQINTSSHAATIGEEGHKVLGDTTGEYIARGDSWMTRKELAEWVEGAARHSRPDVQPEVIQAVKYSAWAWAEYIGGINHENILHYDGGEGERSGQLSVEWPEWGALLTSEVDLLHAGETPEVLYETDYKCGQKVHLEASVKTGFQFHFHALLVFANYPDVEELRVRVWNTRTNRRTYEVPFYRKNLPDYKSRVTTSVGVWYQWRNEEPDRCPTWPTKEKCRICDAADRCDPYGLYGDPEEILAALISTRFKMKKFEDDLKAIVDDTGRDVKWGGYAFGRCKPKRETRSTTTLYEV